MERDEAVETGDRERLKDGDKEKEFDRTCERIKS
jgi:hypothetical protein